jgi:hypothetical protein
MSGVLKYRIKSILGSLPAPVAREKRKELREKLGRSPQMFTLCLNATTDKTLDFVGMELPTIANILNVDISELFTKVVTHENNN